MSCHYDQIKTFLSESTWIHIHVKLNESIACVPLNSQTEEAKWIRELMHSLLVEQLWIVLLCQPLCKCTVHGKPCLEDQTASRERASSGSGISHKKEMKLGKGTELPRTAVAKKFLELPSWHIHGAFSLAINESLPHPWSLCGAIFTTLKEPKPGSLPQNLMGTQESDLPWRRAKKYHTHVYNLLLIVSGFRDTELSKGRWWHDMQRWDHLLFCTRSQHLCQQFGTRSNFSWFKWIIRVPPGCHEALGERECKVRGFCILNIMNFLLAGIWMALSRTVSWLYEEFLHSSESLLAPFPLSSFPSERQHFKHYRY